MAPPERAGVVAGCGLATLTTCKSDFSSLAPGDQSCSCAIVGALGAGRAIAAGVTGRAGAAAGALIGTGWRVIVDSTNRPDPDIDEIGAGLTARATIRPVSVGPGSREAASRRCFSTDKR